MDLVLASNFRPDLVEATNDLPVSTFFGNFPTTLIGGGRPPHILPAVTEEGFRRHLEAVHAAGRSFYATLNSSDLGLQEYRPAFLPALSREVARLVDLGVDGFVVAIPAVIDRIHREYPDLPLTVSTFARIRTVAQAEYYLRKGAETIVIEEANRDLALLRGLVRAGARVEVLVNQTCIHDCPYRFHHLNTSSLASQEATQERPWFEYPILECGLELIRDPVKLVSGIFVRPEDLSVLEEVGVHRFKISGRNQTTAWLVRAATAYAARRYDGDLLDILSYVQNRGPRGALRRLEERGEIPETVSPLARAFETLGTLEIDNRRFPPGFLRRVVATDCAHTSCATCGYCASVARRVVKIAGRPLEAYRPPEDLPDPLPLLAAFGTTPGARAATPAANRAGD
jgi:collagenase-like PrtC family protease